MLHSKCIKDLNLKPDTLKLIEKKLGKTLEDMDTGEKFLNRTPIAYALRSRIGKWHLIKLQSFCKAKETVKRTKRQPTDISPLLDVGLVKIFSQFVDCRFVLLTVSLALQKLCNFMRSHLSILDLRA